MSAEGPCVLLVGAICGWTTLIGALARHIGLYVEDSLILWASYKGRSSCTWRC